MAFIFEKKKYVLNPLLFSKIYEDYVLIYVPYKHTFLRFNKEEFEQIKEGKLINKELIEKKVFVEESYKEKFIKNYKRFIPDNPELGLMYLILTDSCNFRCPYCFIENNYPDKRRSMMSWDVAKKAIDHYFENVKTNDKKIIFYGGEPTLNEGVLIKAIQYIRSKSDDVYIGINTNGSKYSKKLSSVFKEGKVIVSISLDGFKKINNKTRLNSSFEGTYENVVSNVKRYIGDGVVVSFSITINGYNVDYLPAISKFIVKEFPTVKSIGYNLSLQNLKGNELFADPEYSSFQLYNSFRILRQNGVYEDRVLRRLKHLINKTVYLKDCAGCGNQIVVLPNGEVGPCHGFAGTKEYFDSTVDDLDFMNSDVMKRWNQLSPINKKECVDSNCPFLLICGNSCPYYSKITRGSLDAVDDRMYPFLSVMMQEVGKDAYLSGIKAIGVDYDGTLISRRSTYDILKEIANKIGYKGILKRRDFYDVREIIEGMAKSVGREKEVNDFIYYYVKKWKEDSKLNYALVNQLKKIKEIYGLPIYILTNTSKKRIMEELDEPVKKIINDVFSPEKFKKPNKKYYLEVFKKIKVKPEEFFYIGDSYYSDMKPIYELGIRGAVSFYANNEYLEDLDNDWLVDIIKDVMSKNDNRAS